MRREDFLEAALGEVGRDEGSGLYSLPSLSFHHIQYTFYRIEPLLCEWAFAATGFYSFTPRNDENKRQDMLWMVRDSDKCPATAHLLQQPMGSWSVMFMGLLFTDTFSSVSGYFVYISFFPKVGENFGSKGQEVSGRM